MTYMCLSSFLQTKCSTNSTHGTGRANKSLHTFITLNTHTE